MKKITLQTDFDSPTISPGFLLWQISNTWQSRQRKALKDFDLTHVQFVLLASLVWVAQDRCLTQKELAQHAKTNIMMTSQVVRVLERKGLITRTVSSRDGRSFTLNPTSKGVALANRAIKAAERVDALFFKRLEGDTRSFITMMQRLAG